MDAVTQLNWVDIAVLILLFRIGYVALKTGLPLEVFKFLGVITAIYISCHYYTALSDFMRQRLTGKVMPLALMDFLCFVILANMGYLAFVLLRGFFSHLMKMEPVTTLFKWAGLALGLVRGYLICGIIVFSMSISSVQYLKTSASHSYLGKRLFEVPSSIYAWLWQNVTSNFMTGEKYNSTIDEIKQGFLNKE